MPNSPWSGQTNLSGAKKDEAAPKLKAQQDWQNMAALRQRIADLHARQKEAILRLSTQRTSVEEVGVTLAELEKELSVAQEQLERLIQQTGGRLPGK